MCSVCNVIVSGYKSNRPGSIFAIQGGQHGVIGGSRKFETERGTGDGGALRDSGAGHEPIAVTIGGVIDTPIRYDNGDDSTGLLGVIA